MRGSLDRDAWRIVLREDTANAPILGPRMILAPKAIGTGEEKWKGSFVCRGFLDPYKQVAVHQAGTFRMESVRLIFALACILGFSVWTQASGLLATPNMRRVFLEAIEPVVLGRLANRISGSRTARRIFAIAKRPAA